MIYRWFAVCGREKGIGALLIASSLLYAFMMPAGLASTVPTPPPPPRCTIIDDTADGWAWNGMSVLDLPDFKGGQGHAGGPGTSGTYTFKGTGVHIYVMAGPSVAADGGRTHKMGSMIVTLDGIQQADVSLSRPDIVYNFDAYSITNLPDQNHVLELDAAHGWVVVDYIVVIGSATDASRTESSNTAGETVVGPGKSGSGDSGHPTRLVAYNDAMQGPTVSSAKIPVGQYRIAPASDPGLTIVNDHNVDGSPVEIGRWPAPRYNLRFSVGLSGGRYHIYPANALNYLASKQLAIVGPGDVHGIPVTLAPSVPAGAGWIITALDNGYCRVSPGQYPGLALTVPDDATTDGARVQCLPWTGAPNQLWTFADLCKGGVQ